MKAEQARELLRSSAAEAGASDLEPGEKPDDADMDWAEVHLPASVLDDLSVDDLPERVRLGIGEQKDTVVHVEWPGVLVRTKDGLHAEVDLTHTRKYWYEPVNLEHYLDLVRRAVERRQSIRGDVSLAHKDDDGAYVHLVYNVANLPTSSLGDAYRAAKKIEGELSEAADRATDKVGQLIAAAAQEIGGWGDLPLEQLVEKAETEKNSQQKGILLEELAARIFESIPGLTTANRIRTATEEIDIAILNASTDARLSREEALLLVECKNWSGKCGKNEFVILHEKIANRRHRCSLGFLVSWNGFAQTVTAEMLRGSRERNLIVPLDGRQLRAAIREKKIEEHLFAAWQAAIML